MCIHLARLAFLFRNDERTKIQWDEVLPLSSCDKKTMSNARFGDCSRMAEAFLIAQHAFFDSDESVLTDEELQLMPTKVSDFIDGKAYRICQSAALQCCGKDVPQPILPLEESRRAEAIEMALEKARIINDKAQAELVKKQVTDQMSELKKAQADMDKHRQEVRDERQKVQNEKAELELARTKFEALVREARIKQLLGDEKSKG